MFRPATGVLLLLLAAGPAVGAQPLGRLTLALRNAELHGRLVDHTHNHGKDRRIWSSALGEKRDLYVYLPPNFDPRRQYPLILWLHGMIDDERIAACRDLPQFDRAIAAGTVPPAIIAIPDGRYHPQHGSELPFFDDDFPCVSWWTRWDHGFPFDSHFVNSRAGRYGDYLTIDVLPFLECHYPIRPEPQARAVMGFSLSGWAAYALALKHKESFGVVAAVFAPLNMRWLDCHGNYKGDFSPCCQGWRTELTENENIGFLFGVPASLRRGIEPYFGWGPEGLARLSAENPIELLDRCDIRPGEVAMWVAYVENDQFNADAQAESFIYRARQRGLCVAVDRRRFPIRRHSLSTVLETLPAGIDWVGAQLMPFHPCRCISPRYEAPLPSSSPTRVEP